LKPPSCSKNSCNRSSKPRGSLWLPSTMRLRVFVSAIVIVHYSNTQVVLYSELYFLLHLGTCLMEHGLFLFGHPYKRHTNRVLLEKYIRRLLKEVVYVVP